MLCCRLEPEQMIIGSAAEAAQLLHCWVEQRDLSDVSVVREGVGWAKYNGQYRSPPGKPVGALIYYYP